MYAGSYRLIVSSCSLLSSIGLLETMIPTGVCVIATCVIAVATRFCLVCTRFCLVGTRFCLIATQRLENAQVPRSQAAARANRIAPGRSAIDERRVKGEPIRYAAYCRQVSRSFASLRMTHVCDAGYT